MPSTSEWSKMTNVTETSVHLSVPWATPPIIEIGALPLPDGNRFVISELKLQRLMLIPGDVVQVNDENVITDIVQHSPFTSFAIQLRDHALSTLEEETAKFIAFELEIRDALEGHEFEVLNDGMFMRVVTDDPETARRVLERNDDFAWHKDRTPDKQQPDLWEVQQEWKPNPFSEEGQALGNIERALNAGMPVEIEIPDTIPDDWS